MEFKDKIIKLREDNKLTLESVANKTEISEDELSKLELGTSQPNLDQIRRLASFYDVSIESLVDDNIEATKTRKGVRKRLNVLKLVAKMLYFSILI